MSTVINIDIDHSLEVLMVYVASNDGLEDAEQYDKLFSWVEDDDFGIALEEAEEYARRLSWKLGYEIRKNYGEIA